MPTPPPLRPPRHLDGDWLFSDPMAVAGTDGPDPAEWDVSKSGDNSGLAAPVAGPRGGADRPRRARRAVLVVVVAGLLVTVLGGLDASSEFAARECARAAQHPEIPLNRR